MVQPEEIEKRVAQYKQKLMKASTAPPQSEDEKRIQRAQRLMQRVQSIEEALERSSRQKLRVTMRAMKAQADAGDLASVYGYCAEVMLLCRTDILGVKSAWPISRSVLPPGTMPRQLSEVIEHEMHEGPDG